MKVSGVLGQPQRWLDSIRALRIAYIVLCLSVMVDLGIYLLGHRSASILALAGLSIAFALGGIGVTVWVGRLTIEGISRLRGRAARWRDLYLTITLALLFGFGLGMRAEWTYIHIAVLLSASFVLGYHLLYADALALSRRWLVVAGVSFVIVTLLRLNALSEYPTQFLDDEPQVLGWAMSYVQHGTFFDTVMYYGGADVQRFMLPVAWWISIFGPGFWQTRLFFFLLILPLMGLTGLAARNLYGNARLTAFVMLCSAIVMSVARIRHDIGLALAVAASIWLYTEALKRNKLLLHYLAGLAIGLGLFAHYHAIGFGVALTIAFYLPHMIERWQQGKRLPETGMWLFVLGGLMGAGLVFLFQILPDWTGFLAVRIPRNPQSLMEFFHAFIEHLKAILRNSQFEFVLIALATAAAVWRHQRRDLMLVLLVLLMHVALAVQATGGFAYYLVPLTPIYSILIAALFTEGFGVAIQRSLAWVAALVMVVNLGFTLQVPYAHLKAGAPLQPPTPPAATWIRAHVDPSKSIVTQHWYYLFLTDYKFISPLTRTYAPPSKRGDTAEAMWDQIAPDVVVIDRNSITCCIPPILSEDYLKSRGYHEVAEIPGDKYPVLIYEKGKTP